MSIFRNLLMAKAVEPTDDVILPEGYVPCYYLQNSKTQFIELQWKVGYYEEFEFKYFTERFGGTGGGFILGGYSQTTSLFRFGDFWYNSGTENEISLGLGNISVKKRYKSSQSEIHLVNSSPTKGYIVDEEILMDGWERNTGGTLRPYIRLFGCGNGNTSILNHPIKFYYLKISENEEILVHIVPCLDANGVPCMYDAVRNLTLYNGGTGTFGYQRKDTKEIVEPT